MKWPRWAPWKRGTDQVHTRTEKEKFLDVAVLQEELQLLEDDKDQKLDQLAKKKDQKKAQKNESQSDTDDRMIKVNQEEEEVQKTKDNQMEEEVQKGKFLW